MLTRFAPAPTGYLHIGHVVNALYVWGMARDAGGRVLLRIEDHDRQCCRPAYQASILEDLAWLGLTPDLIAPRQSERDAAYRAALLLDSTGRQLRLARMLGRSKPGVFAHHPLVMKTPTQKVSKSDGDTGVRDLRVAGWTAEQVLEQARRYVRL
jgi:glutamyl/glutaminyl-tRNA synthetase